MKTHHPHLDGTITLVETFCHCRHVQNYMLWFHFLSLQTCPELYAVIPLFVTADMPRIICCDSTFCHCRHAQNYMLWFHFLSLQTCPELYAVILQKLKCLKTQSTIENIFCCVMSVSFLSSNILTCSTSRSLPSFPSEFSWRKKQLNEQLCVHNIEMLWAFNVRFMWLAFLFLFLFKVSQEAQSI